MSWREFDVNLYSFNPPFNLKTKTKISKLFLNHLDKHFSPHKKLQRLFNRTNVKIKERCMPYMNFYTYMHNDKVLNDKPNETRINNRNCSKKDTWSLPNSYQTKCIIYQANIDCDKNVTLAHVKQHSTLIRIKWVLEDPSTAFLVTSSTQKMLECSDFINSSIFMLENIWYHFTWSGLNSQEVLNVVII